MTRCGRSMPDRGDSATAAWHFGAAPEAGAVSISAYRTAIGTRVGAIEESQRIWRCLLTAEAAPSMSA